jgi:hypothetical protein
MYAWSCWLDIAAEKARSANARMPMAAAAFALQEQGVAIPSDSEFVNSAFIDL